MRVLGSAEEKGDWAYLCGIPREREGHDKGTRLSL